MTDAEQLIVAVIPTADSYQPKQLVERNRHNQYTILAQCGELQTLILKDAKVSKGSALGQLAKSFVSLEQLKLRIRMKPAPKPVEVQPRGKAKQPRSSFVESPGPAKAPLVVSIVPVVPLETPQS
jgi:hypothetical protein